MYKKGCLIVCLLQSVIFASDITLYDDPQGVKNTITKFKVSVIEDYHLAIDEADDLYCLKLFVSLGRDLNSINRKKLINCIKSVEAVDYLLEIGAMFNEEDISYTSSQIIADKIFQTLKLNSVN